MKTGNVVYRWSCSSSARSCELTGQMPAGQEDLVQAGGVEGHRRGPSPASCRDDARHSTFSACCVMGGLTAVHRGGRSATAMSLCPSPRPSAFGRGVGTGRSARRVAEWQAGWGIPHAHCHLQKQQGQACGWPSNRCAGLHGQASRC